MRDTGLELADDFGDQVRDVREALRLEVAREPHRAGPADSRKVVAAEVDQHHVLGPVLLRAKQPFRVALAGAGRPGDRVQRGLSPVGLDEGLGRRADQAQPIELQQEEVRRGVDAAQGAVELERGSRSRPLGPLGEHDLEGVPGPDVLLRTDDRPFVLVPRRQATRSAALGMRLGRCVGGLRAREQIGNRARLAAEHLNHPHAVVEADEGVRDHEPALWQPAPVLGQLDRRLKPRRMVVPEVADNREPACFGFREVHYPRARADERVAAQPALLDRLEEEARAPAFA